jgi:hypothetical protein
LDLRISQSYALRISIPGGGTVSQEPVPNAQSQRYASNTVVSLTATPAPGWTFLYWSGDAAGTDNVAAVTMNAPRSVQAVFGARFSLATNGNGRILIEPAANVYAYGQPVRITAVPADGSYFFGWAGDFTGFDTPVDFAVNTPAVITALFAPLKSGQVSLTRSSHGAGSITLNPSKNVYTNGETVVLTALPTPGYLFTGWSSDLSGHMNPLAKTLTANTLATANFVQQAVAVTNGILNFVLSTPDALFYQLQYSTNLASGVWIDFGPVQNSTNGKIDASADLGISAQMFFRGQSR